MSTLETRKVEPLSGTTVTLGAAGDAVTMPAGVTLKTNTVKDAGGNIIWTSNGSGTLSSVNSALSGSLIFISSQTASSSSSIAFTSGLDNTYDEYVFYFINMHAGSNGERLQFQANAVGESGYNETITSTYFDANHKEDNSGTPALTYQPNQDQAEGTAYQDLNRGMGVNNDDSHSGELHICNPSSTSMMKQFYGTCSHYEHGVTAMNGYVAGQLNTTSAINAIQFKMSSGNIDDGTIYLYGIK